MAQKRVFSVIDSKDFTAMPLTAQALYFHFSRNAEDDGFVENCQKIQKAVKASNEDFDMLTKELFIIPQWDGAIVVRHCVMREYLKSLSGINISEVGKENNVKKREQDEELVSNFQKIYDLYPKQGGKTKGFTRYKLWVTTGKVVAGKRVKLTNKQIWMAIKTYISTMEREDRDVQYYKNFDTFMGDTILDYVREAE